jgi:hypothetical protein
MQKMAKRAKLTTEQVLEGWENFEEEVEDREAIAFFHLLFILSGFV